jgi:hypothetical protein
MDGSTPAPSFSRSSESTEPRSPGHTPQQLQNHLYEAFLTGQTADVSLVVRGSWNAIYKLHRIVLTQAVCEHSGCRSFRRHAFLILSQGFFRSLFTSGFAEGSANANVNEGKVQMRFDHDPNITRAGGKRHSVNGIILTIMQHSSMYIRPNDHLMTHHH